MTEKLTNTVNMTCNSVFARLLQWERLRHPLAGWARLIMLLLFPVVIWSHDWLLIGFLLVALLSHPYWFPAYVEAGDDIHILTQMVDIVQKWAEETSPSGKLRAMLPGVVLFIPFVCALWAHSAFWTMYFLAALLGLNALFFARIFQEDGDSGE